MVAYEILLLLDPELAEERQSEIVARTRELIEQGGGAWQNQEIWGRRKLAYEIDKKGEGFYHLLTFEAEPATLDEVSRVLKISAGVLRHLATRQIEGTPPHRHEADREPAYASANTRSQDEEE